MSVTNIRDARRALADGGEQFPGAVGAARRQAFRSRFSTRSELVGGATRQIFEGYASVTERGYEMWDMFGSYTEVMAAGAFDTTLRNSPDVAFLTNHGGVTMARTSRAGKPGTLTLDADGTGLHDVASTNPDRPDVQILMHATQDGDVDEQSFAFMIENGEWDPTYSTFRVTQVNIDRGDVSAVNYGANPYTSMAARSSEIMRSLERMPAGFARAAIDRLQARADRAPFQPEPPAAAIAAALQPTGFGVTHLAALLDLDR